jgi:hypothetical protein
MCVIWINSEQLYMGKPYSYKLPIKSKCAQQLNTTTKSTVVSVDTALVALTL